MGNYTEFLISTPVIQPTVVYAQWNATPDAVNDMASTATDTAVIVNVLANDTDPDGDTLSVASVTQGTSGGTVTINAGTTVTYTPLASFSGTDTFTYTISDGNGGEDTATVTVYINTNAPPTAADDTYTTDEDTALVISNSLSGLLANDSDIDGTINVLSYIQPAHGSLTVNINGTFTYTPDADYNGPDSFEYTIEDNGLATATATVNITVTSVNDTPLAVNDSYSTDKDTTLTVNAASGVLSNDTIGDGLQSLVLTTNVAHGTLTLNTSDGSFVYEPSTGYSGSDSFEYTITDSDNETSTATVSITVNSSTITVTHVYNDGVTSDTTGIETVGSNYSSLPSPDPTRPGYTFDGWELIDGTSISSSTEVTLTSDHSVYAQWIQDTYLVTLDKQLGTGGTDSVTVANGSPMPSAAAPARNGYTFGG